jgi:hypothetical protein
MNNSIFLAALAGVTAVYGSLLSPVARMSLAGGELILDKMPGKSEHPLSNSISSSS